MVEKTQSDTAWPALFDPLRGFGSRLSDWLQPATDAKVEDGAYRITMELPGVEEKDIELTVENGLVTVSGEKRQSREEKDDTWYFSERSYGSFRRSFRVPQDADEDAVKAELKDGILTVTVPRKTGTAAGRKVPVAKG